MCADFTGLHCVVSNSLGEGSPCPAEVVLEVELSRLQQQELVIILVICGVTLTLLLLLALATCYYCSRRHKQPDKGEQTSYLVIHKSSYPQQTSPFLPYLSFWNKLSPRVYWEVFCLEAACVKLDTTLRSVHSFCCREEKTHSENSD